MLLARFGVRVDRTDTCQALPATRTLRASLDCLAYGYVGRLGVAIIVQAMRRTDHRMPSGTKVWLSAARITR
jgi:hypothetical protein